MHTPPTSPTSRTLVLLGEAPGEEEERQGVPFVGPSGSLLRQTLLPLAGLDVAEWHLTNVFQQRPPNNDLTAWTANKLEHKQLGLIPRGSPITKRHLLPEYWPQVETTQSLLTSLQPSLIIALGGKALWALTGDDRITLFRGTFFQTRFGPAIATFHPAAILREYKMLPIAAMDLRKARLWLEGTIAQPLRRRLYLNPTEDELQLIYRVFGEQPHIRLGVDIETCPSLGQITSVSFCTSTLGICIPIWDQKAKPGARNYWPTAAAEVQAWRWIERYAKLPNPKVLQNGPYDMQYLLDAPIDIRLRGHYDDTSLMQHTYQPELRKDLGTLASLYLNEPSWKQMRSTKEAKADE